MSRPNCPRCSVGRASDPAIPDRVQGRTHASLCEYIGLTYEEAEARMAADEREAEAEPEGVPERPTKFVTLEVEVEYISGQEPTRADVATALFDSIGGIVLVGGELLVVRILESSPQRLAHDG